MRTARRRMARMDLLESSARFPWAQELHATLSKQGVSVAPSTVYRALRPFVESGDDDVFRVTDGEIRYRRCDRTDQHGHLICRICGRTEGLRGDRQIRYPGGRAQAQSGVQQHFPRDRGCRNQ